MNKKLIFLLSLAGLAMAIISLFVFINNIEPYLWLLIFIIYAFVIAKYTSEKRFLNGFVVGLFNGVWIGCIHSIFFSTYITNNPEMMKGYEQMPKIMSPELMTLITGPIIGALTGLIIGLFAYLAGKFIQKN